MYVLDICRYKKWVLKPQFTYGQPPQAHSAHSNMGGSEALIIKGGLTRKYATLPPSSRPKVRRVTLPIHPLTSRIELLFVATNATILHVELKGIKGAEISIPPSPFSDVVSPFSFSTSLAKLITSR